MTKATANAVADITFSEDGQLELVSGANAVGQHVRHRLLTFQGEWFLDTEAGLPWFDEILGNGASNNPAVLAEALIKTEIWETPSVTDILSFDVSLNSKNRILGITNVVVQTSEEGGIANV